jgi:hypothetical protein
MHEARTMRVPAEDRGNKWMELVKEGVGFFSVFTNVSFGGF